MTIEQAVPNRRPECTRIYDGEVIGVITPLQRLQTASELMTEHDFDRGGLPTCKIFSDCQGMVRALRKKERWHDDSPLCELRDVAKQVKGQMAEGARLELHWIPGHRFIEGNEAADKKAKEAVAKGKNPSRETRKIMRVGEEANETAWQRAQQQHQPRRTAQAIGASYNSSRGKEYRCFQRRITTKQAKRRVAWLGGYLYTRRDLGAWTCQQCHFLQPPTDSQEAHLLLECPALRPLRQRLDLSKGPDDNDNWLALHPRLDEYLAHLDTLRDRGDEEEDTEEGHQEEAAGDQEMTELSETMALALGSMAEALHDGNSGDGDEDFDDDDDGDDFSIDFDFSNPFEQSEDEND